MNSYMKWVINSYLNSESGIPTVRTGSAVAQSRRSRVGKHWDAAAGCARLPLTVSLSGVTFTVWRPARGTQAPRTGRLGPGPERWTRA